MKSMYSLGIYKILCIIEVLSTFRYALNIHNRILLEHLEHNCYAFQCSTINISNLVLENVGL